MLADDPACPPFRHKEAVLEHHDRAAEDREGKLLSPPARCLVRGFGVRFRGDPSLLPPVRRAISDSQVIGEIGQRHNFDTRVADSFGSSV